jgi:hypothetical protein
MGGGGSLAVSLEEAGVDDPQPHDPFAPIDASPRFATPLALAALVSAAAALLTGLAAVAGPLGMALGLISHVKGSRLGMPAAVTAGLAMIAGFTITLYLR